MWKQGGLGAVGIALCGVVAGGLAGGCSGDHTGVAAIGAGGTGGTAPIAGAGGDVGTAGAGDAGTGAGGTGGAGTGAGGTGGAGTGAGGTGGAGTGTGGTGGAGTGAGGTGGAGPGGGTGTAGAGGGFMPPGAASWILNGGDAPSGLAAPGGQIHIIAQGPITLGASAPAAPPVPAAPADAIAVDGAALAADVTVAGSIRLDETLAVGGSEAIRQITSTGGDIFVSGSLRGGDAGGVGRGLTLRAPAGTIYVAGTIDTNGADGGPNAGAIVIAAQRVVVTGTLSANGADAPNGGRGGRITITATDLVFLGGPVQAGGGAGTSFGGAGGELVVDTAGALQAAHLVDARGGAGVGPNAVGGEPGAIKVGQLTPPSLVNVAVPLSLRGGAGGVAGGRGGLVTLEPKNGNLVVAGTVDFGGGDAMARPGDGGAFIGVVGAGVGTLAVDGGDVVITGRLSGNGGAVVDGGGTGNGGVAGLVDIEPVSVLGAFVVAPSAVVTLDGGASGGAGIAGGGGHLFFTTKDGDLTMGGKLSLRGGNAPDAGGTGGLGGAVDIFTDANYDGIGGNLLIDLPGVIDASGGTGTIGGSGRDNGGVGGASFPDGLEMIAVLINCDGKHGTTENWLLNLGWIIARGGAANGNGGDIIFHGISPDRDSSPPSGNIDNAGSGTGRPGDYGAE